MSINESKYRDLATLDLIAIGHVTSGTIAFTLIYYPFVLFGVPSAIMVGWAFFLALIANRVYLGFETKILASLDLTIQRDSPGAVVFLTILALIGSLIALAMSFFWINCIAIGVEATAFLLLYKVLKDTQGTPSKKKVNVKRLAKQYAKVRA
ncbi:MAG: hypothetical protein EU530_00235 [Promethearchaeota archaeon]|nr:MAG: hypothetical protein EU530_00235 [Candidatus Lokiarchaeota archaeon]